VPTHVALLRGINVGGRNRVAMADLRDAVESLGHTGVETYIQSGNVVFTTAETDTAALAAALERSVAERTGVQAGVVVLTRDELDRVVSGNPYPEEPDPKRVHVVFHRGGTRDVDAVAAAEQRARDKGSRDRATVVDGTLYLHTPDGLGRSELAAQLAKPAVARQVGDTATTRNWSTVLRLQAMLQG
jgi:uncharacterized protein (DUF1697 family)